MVTAILRFHEELNDFLPLERRRLEFSAPCAEAATTKHMIEALGVPHTEVELILVRGESTGFDRRLREGDRVAVYPKFEALDVTPLLRAPGKPRCILTAPPPAGTARQRSHTALPRAAAPSNSPSGWRAASPAALPRPRRSR